MITLRSALKWLIISGTVVAAACSQEAPEADTAEVQAAVTIGSVTPEAKLIADVSLGAQLGLSVAVSGNTVIAGAFRDNTAGQNAGALFAYERVDGVWSAPVRLNAPIPCNLGERVAIDGDTAFGFGGCSGGSVHVFQRTAGIWAFSQRINVPGSGTFGLSMALQGDVALIGDQARATAYVFTRTGGVWSQQAALTPSQPAQAFGSSVALDGDTALIATEQADSFAGVAYVFTRSGSTWTERARLASPSSDFPFFGMAVALHDGTALISTGGPISALDEPGAVHVFVGGGSNWALEATLLPARPTNGEFFGASIDYENDVAVIGSPLSWHEETDIVDAGNTYVFSRAAGTWTEAFKLAASDPARGDQFGTSVSLSGNLIVGGAKNGNLRHGAAYTFSYTAIQSDSDSDGVPDGADECNATPAGAVVDASGCAIPQLCPCEAPVGSVCGWQNHTAYVKCVRVAAQSFRRAGVITNQQRAQIVQAAQQSQCGRH